MANNVTKKYDDLPPSTIGKRCQWLRQKRSEKQEDIADKVLHVSRITLTYYETETRQIPTEVIVTLAKHYDVSTDFLLCLTDIPNNNIDDISINKAVGINNVATAILRLAKGIDDMAQEWTQKIENDLEAKNINFEDFFNQMDVIRQAQNLIKSVNSFIVSHRFGKDMEKLLQKMKNYIDENKGDVK